MLFVVGLFIYLLGKFAQMNTEQ